MRRLLLAAALAAVVLGGMPAQAGFSRFPVVITGDSILQLGQDLLWSPHRFVDVESGRQPAQAGNEGRYSTAEAAEVLIPLVEPGGFLVVQDNGINASDAQWRALLREIVDDLADDRCLVGVLPVFLHADPAVTAAAAVRANIMVAEFSRQPCHDWIRWNQKVAADPSLVYDGQHPSAAGRAWLASQIDLVTGTATSCDV